MIATAEVENNKPYPQYTNLGICETGSAFILKKTSHNAKGFGGIKFYTFPEYLSLFTAYWTWQGDQHYIEFERAKEFHNCYLNLILNSLTRFLDQEAITLSDIDWIIPPFISDAFTTSLAQLFDDHSDKLIAIDNPGCDLYTSSIPYGLSELLSCGKAEDGDICLIISVGSGIQIGFGLYYF
jgi:3-oxoacyl-[acyl-carrier-protein] synthase III